MSDEELLHFATEVAGISIKPGWRREAIITHIMRAASYCENYA